MSTPAKPSVILESTNRRPQPLNSPRAVKLCHGKSGKEDRMTKTSYSLFVFSWETTYSFFCVWGGGRMSFKLTKSNVGKHDAVGNKYSNNVSLTFTTQFILDGSFTGEGNVQHWVWKVLHVRKESGRRKTNIRDQNTLNSIILTKCT